MLVDETAAKYHARKAISASMLITCWQECPLIAWWQSPWNEARERENHRHLDIGTAAHLAVLEPHLLVERIVLIEAADYRTKAAREERDRAWLCGMTPLLPHEAALVEKLRLAVENSHAAPLFFGEGQSEQTYLWEFAGRTSVSCKARVDRIPNPKILVDLKTASSASPAAFQAAAWRDGHYIRAAWYIDGWLDASGQLAEYRFVVVGKEPPYPVAVYTLDERTLAWGRQCYMRALAQIAEGLATGRWRGYQDAAQEIGLPAYAEYALADRESAEASGR